MLVWLLAFILSVPVLGAAHTLEDAGAELAAAFMTANSSLLLAGAMAVTWKWLTREKEG